MKFDYLSVKELPKDERKLVGFIVDEVCYGLPIMTVREVINPAAVTKMPALSSYVLGVAEHRDDVIPIVNLRARFNLKKVERTRRTKWIIARTDERREMGIEVDRVTEVITVDASMQKDTPLWTVKQEPWILGLYQAKGSLIFELDLATLIDDGAFLPPEEKEIS